MAIPSDSKNPEFDKHEAQREVEHISDNYFEQVNHEFNEAMSSGEIFTNENTIDEIKKRNEQDFFDTIVDAIKAPGEAIKWLKTTLMATFAKSWLGEIFGFKEELQKKKQEIMEMATNPVNILTEIMVGLAGFKVFKFLTKGKIPGSGSLKWGLRGIKLMGKSGIRIAAFGAVAIGIYSLYEYFKANPEEAKKMPESKEGRMKFFSEKLDKLGLKDEKEKVMALIMGEQKAKEMFADLENYDPETDPELIKAREEKEKQQQEKEKQLSEKYGELETIEEKMEREFKHVKEKLKKFILEIKNFLLKNKTATIIGGLYLAQIKMLRKLLIGGAGASSKVLLILAQLPFKSAKNHPIATTFGIIGLMEGLKYSKDILVPKDPDKFKEFLKDAFNEKTEKIGETSDKYLEKFQNKTNELLANKDIEISIDEEKIDETIDTIKDPSRFEKFVTSLEDYKEMFVTGTAEYISLKPDELIFNKNNDALEIFKSDIEIMFCEDEDNELKAFLDKLYKKYQTTKELTKEDFQDLERISLQYGIDIEIYDGYYTWSKIENGEIVEGPNKFFIDPSLSKEEQKEKAYKFYYNGTGIEGIATGAQMLLHMPFNRFREEFSDVYEGIKSGDSVFMVVGGELVCLGVEGVAEKYVLGPVDMYSEVIEQLSKEGDFDYAAVAAEWGEGIMPVMFIGVAGSLPKILRNPKNIKGITGRLILDTLTYPIKPLVKAGKISLFIGKDIAWQGLRGNIEIAKFNAKYNPATLSILEKKRKFFEKIYDYKTVMAKIPGARNLINVNKATAKKMEICFDVISTSYADQIKYQQAMLLLNEGRSKKLLGSSGKNKIRDNASQIISSISGGNKNDALLEKIDTPETINEAINDIENKIKEIETRIQNNKNKARILTEEAYMKKANDYVNKANKAKSEGKSKKAEKLYKKAENALVFGGIEAERIKTKDIRKTKTQELLEEQLKTHERKLEILDKSISKVDFEKGISSPKLEEGKQKQEILSENKEKLEVNERIEKIRQIDSDIIDLQVERENRITEIIHEASVKGEAIDSGKRQEMIKKINIDIDAEIKTKFKHRSSHALSLDYETIRKEKLYIDEGIAKKCGIEIEGNKSKYIKRDAFQYAIKEGRIKFSEKLKLHAKSAGKGVAVLAVVLIAAYIGGLYTEDELQIDDLKTDEKKKTKNSKLKEKLEKNPDYFHEGLTNLNYAFSSHTAFYAELFNTITDNGKIRKIKGLEHMPRKDSNITKTFETINPAYDYYSIHSGNEKPIELLINASKERHKKSVIEIKRIINANHEFLENMFKYNPDLQEKAFPIGPFMYIRYDKENEKVFLTYPNEEDFTEQCWGIVDYTETSVKQEKALKAQILETIKSNPEAREKFEKEHGKDIDIAISEAMQVSPDFLTIEQGIEIIKGAIPVTGSIRDLVTASKEFMRGNDSKAWKDFGWGAAGLIIDVGTMGAGSVAKSGAKASTKTGKAIFKGMKAMDAHSGKIMLTAMGLDVGYNTIGALKIIETNESYYAKGPKEWDDIDAEPPTFFTAVKEKDVGPEKFYEEAIYQLKDELVWKNITHEVIDENKLIIGRSISDEKVKIYKEEDGTWNLEEPLTANGGYKTFQQAVAMANLANKTNEWLKENKYEGANSSPFYISIGGDVEFDENWRPDARNYFNSDSKWLKFYKTELDIPKDWIINLLNRAYSKYKKGNTITARFEKLKERINKTNK